MTNEANGPTPDQLERDYVLAYWHRRALEAEAKAKELAAELEETIYQAWGTHSRPVAP